MGLHHAVSRDYRSYLKPINRLPSGAAAKDTIWTGRPRKAKDAVGFWLTLVITYGTHRSVKSVLPNLEANSKMPKAIWNGVVVAESDRCEVVEGNQYFPPDSIKSEYFTPSEKQTSCPWKGTSSYYTLVVNGKTNPDAAWYYPDPKSAAANIKDHVAFWRGVSIEV